MSKNKFNVLDELYNLKKLILNSKYYNEESRDDLSRILGSIESSTGEDNLEVYQALSDLRSDIISENMDTMERILGRLDYVYKLVSLQSIRASKGPKDIEAISKTIADIYNVKFCTPEVFEKRLEIHSLLNDLLDELRKWYKTDPKKKMILTKVQMDFLDNLKDEHHPIQVENTLKKYIKAAHNNDVFAQTLEQSRVDYIKFSFDEWAEKYNKELENAELEILNHETHIKRLEKEEQELVEPYQSPDEIPDYIITRIDRYEEEKNSESNLIAMRNDTSRILNVKLQNLKKLSGIVDQYLKLHEDQASLKWIIDQFQTFDINNPEAIEKMYQIVKDKVEPVKPLIYNASTKKANTKTEKTEMSEEQRSLLSSLIAKNQKEMQTNIEKDEIDSKIANISSLGKLKK